MKNIEKSTWSGVWTGAASPARAIPPAASIAKHPIAAANRPIPAITSPPLGQTLPSAIVTRPAFLYETRCEN
ncbi:MAG: hypothetical protein J0H08_04490 [Rhizobiales bacterium]|nr:hypothetical protein [Hyphomicrobiales bacterium]